MILFVGLGNPGKAYAGNRHNIGFMAIEAIARAASAPAPFAANFTGASARSRSPANASSCWRRKPI